MRQTQMYLRALMFADHYTTYLNTAALYFGKKTHSWS